MGRHKSVLPVAPVLEHMRATTTLHVSKGAARILTEFLHHYAEQLAKQAHLNAAHRGKRTVEAQDVMLAYKQLQ